MSTGDEKKDGSPRVFGTRNATKAIEQIEASKQRPFESVLFAIGIRNIGKTTAEVLARAFKTMDALMEASDFDYDLKAVAHNWNCGSVVRSWLMELMEQQLGEHPGLEDIRGVVDASGEAKWTVETALDLEVPVPVIALSLMTRNASHIEDSFANKAVAAMRNGFGGHAIHTK